MHMLRSKKEYSILIVYCLLRKTDCINLEQINLES